jgi:hypothetical protein
MTASLARLGANRYRNFCRGRLSGGERAER